MIYVSSSCIKKNKIAEVIQYLESNGIRNIELSGGTDYYDGIEDDLQMLKQKHHLNYACHAYFPPPVKPFVVNLASCNDKIYQESLNHYIQCVDMLKRIDCKVLSVHAGFMVEISTDEIGKRLNDRVIYEEDKAYDRFCTAYCFLSRLCAENGIEVFLENNVLSAENYKSFGYHNYMMMTDYDSIMRMKKQLNFNLLLDLGHLHVSANSLGLDFVQECNMLRNDIRWLHLSDNDGRIDEHRPLRKESEIVREFYKIYDSHIPVTLETIGSAAEILASIDAIKGQCM